MATNVAIPILEDIFSGIISEIPPISVSTNNVIARIIIIIKNFLPSKVEANSLDWLIEGRHSEC